MNLSNPKSRFLFTVVVILAGFWTILFNIQQVEAANPYIQNMSFGQDEQGDYISFDWMGVPERTDTGAGTWWSCQRDVVEIWLNRFNPDGTTEGMMFSNYWPEGDFIPKNAYYNGGGYSGFGNYGFASGLSLYDCATNDPNLSTELPKHIKTYINPNWSPERLSFTGEDFITIQIIGLRINAQYAELLTNDSEQYFYHVPENPLTVIPYTNVKFGFNDSNQLNVSFDWVGPNRAISPLVGFNGKVIHPFAARFFPDVEKDVSMTWEKSHPGNLYNVGLFSDSVIVEKGKHYNFPVEQLHQWTPTVALKHNCSSWGIWWMCEGKPPITKEDLESLLGRNFNADDYITVAFYSSNPSQPSNTQYVFNDSNKYFFEPPCEGVCITDINPKSGAPGIPVTIEGRNFNDNFGLSRVYFGQNLAKRISWDENRVVVKAPLVQPNSGTHIVDVWMDASGESNTASFAYNEPTIEALQPNIGNINTQVKILGYDFGIPRKISSLFRVNFGKSVVPYNHENWRDKEIEVKAASDYGTGEDNKNFLSCLLFAASSGVAAQLVEIPPLVPSLLEEWTIDKCGKWLLNLFNITDVKIDSDNGKIMVDVKITTPVGESNTETFTYKITPLLQVDLDSPGELQVYNSYGQVSGMVNGKAQEQISLSMYDSENEMVTIPQATDQYVYRIIGTSDDIYGINLLITDQATTTIFRAIDIPILVGEVHQYAVDWQAISQGDDGVILQIDSDGDGIFEKEVIADSMLTQDEFVLQTKTNIDIDPDVLNLKSNGKFITAYIELPTGFVQNDIDTTTILLNEVIPIMEQPVTFGDYDNDGIIDLMVKYNREEVKQLFVDTGEVVEMRISGTTLHNGDNLKFVGVDYITLIR